MRAGHGDGIGIHAQGFHAGKKSVHVCLDALRPVAEKAQLPAADRAPVVDALPVTAVVADEHLVTLMVRQTDAAVRTRIRRAAFSTGDELTRTAPVEKQNALFTAAEVFLQFGIEHGADRAGIAVSQLLLHVGNDDIRQLARVEAIRQRKIVIAAGLGVIAADNVRRRRAEQQQRAMLRTAKFCHVARMVARCALGFVGILLLLVDDEQAKVLHGRKDGAACADDDARKAGADAFPLIITLRERKAAVQNGHRISKVRGKRLDHLRRQRDLGHEQDRPLPCRERLLDQVQVNERLAAAGHAEQQRRLCIRRAQQRLQTGKHLCLRRRERRDGLRLPGIMRRAAEIGLRIDVNELLPHKRLHRRLRCTGKLTHLVGRGAADRAQQLQNCDLMRRASTAADLLLRLLERDGKARILELLVTHDALFRPLDGQELLLHEPVQRARGIFVAKRRLQRLQRAAPAVREHGLERQPPLPGAAAQRKRRIGIQLRRNAVDRADTIPDTGRQDRVQRIVDGAEKAVMHPDGEPDQLR